MPTAESVQRIDPAHVVGFGARTSLGLNAVQTAMLVRARQGKPRAIRFRDRHERPAGMCICPAISPDLTGFDRLTALLAPALVEAFPRVESVGTWPLYLALPDKDRPDNDPRLDGEIFQILAAVTGVPIDVEKSRTFRVGHAGGALAMHAALADLHRGAPGAYVAGVESYYHPDVITQLDLEYRLHAFHIENGFVPGEGAAVLSLSGTALQPEKPSIRILRAAWANEDTVVTDEPNLATAMTQILRDLVTENGSEKISWAMCDVNAERHRLREWQFASGRGSLTDDARVDRPADDLGDLGAASATVFAALACAYFQTACAPHSTACIAVHSDGPERAAFLVDNRPVSTLNSLLLGKKAGVK
ncbi:MAG: hypothetical protein IPK82_41695 [Polyangiaceae bacterium]|nr:hypothetical protein [Polyangiaceae bacterium]